MHHRFAPAAAFLASVLFIAPALADTYDLEALIAKSLAQAKAAGAKYENSACGRFFIVEGQYSVTKPEDKPRGYPIEHHLEPWGCWDKPDDMQVTEKFESKSEQIKGGESTQHVADVYGVYLFDRSNSTEIYGTVLDKKGHAIKDADVKAEDINLNKQPVTGKSDSNGKYSLKVSSGQYRVTAKKKSCTTAPQTLWACGWGKVPEGEPGRKRKERFEAHLIADCGDMELDVDSTYKVNATVNYQGVNMKTHGGDGALTGKIPLNLDQQTGAITGEGTLQNTASNMKVTGTADKGVLKGDASYGANEHQYSVKGRLDSNTGIASLALDCMQIGAQHVAVEGTVRAKDGYGYGSVDDTLGATECGGNPVNFEIQWEQGATKHAERTIPWSGSGVTYSRHESYNFTLGDKKKDDEKKDDPKPEPPKPTPPSPTPSSSTGGGKHTTGGGGVPPAPVTDEEEEEKKKKKKARAVIMPQEEEPEAQDDGQDEREAAREAAQEERERAREMQQEMIQKMMEHAPAGEEGMPSEIQEFIGNMLSN